MIKHVCMIENKVYMLDTATINAILNLAKEKYRKLGKHAIVGVEKDGVLDMKREVFRDLGALLGKKKTYSDEGFKVHYI